MEENKTVYEMENKEPEITEDIQDGSSAASGIVLGAAAIGVIILAVVGIKNGAKWIAKKREEYQAKKGV